MQPWIYNLRKKSITASFLFYLPYNYVSFGRLTLFFVNMRKEYSIWKYYVAIWIYYLIIYTYIKEIYRHLESITLWYDISYNDIIDHFLENFKYWMCHRNIKSIVLQHIINSAKWNQWISWSSFMMVFKDVLSDAKNTILNRYDI